jgi:hypothetical protein
MITVMPCIQYFSTFGQNDAPQPNDSARQLDWRGDDFLDSKFAPGIYQLTSPEWIYMTSTERLCYDK